MSVAQEFFDPDEPAEIAELDLCEICESAQAFTVVEDRWMCERCADIAELDATFPPDSIDPEDGEDDAPA